jgi:hypothetical protein
MSLREDAQEALEGKQLEDKQIQVIRDTYAYQYINEELGKIIDKRYVDLSQISYHYDKPSVLIGEYIFSIEGSSYNPLSITLWQKCVCGAGQWRNYIKSLADIGKYTEETDNCPVCKKLKLEQEVICPVMSSYEDTRFCEEYNCGFWSRSYNKCGISLVSPV